VSKRDYCIHFVDLSHLSTIERRAAATWAFDQFGIDNVIDNVDVMNPKENIGRYGTSITPGFWFGREKDAVWFALRWSK